MNNSVRFIAMALILITALGGCTLRKMTPESAFRPLEADPSQYTRKPDAFVVVMDTGSRMERTYRKRVESERAQEIVSRMNRMIPDLDYRSSLLVFSSGTCLSCEDALVLYGPGPYRREDFAAGLEAYHPAGDAARPRPLVSGSEASRFILQGSPGRVALIFVGDSENAFHGRALKAVQKLRGTLGERLCIYPIQVDRACDGRRVMDELVKVGGCGFTVNADEIESPDAMAAYVRAVFLAPAANASWAGPASPAADADGDGVPDASDQCPDTPRSARVDAAGCWTLDHLYFDPGGTRIRDTAVLSEAASVLKADPALKMEVHGHTDGTASSDYNRQLSEARAGVVRDYLIAQGIRAERIRARGFGETSPIASNETVAGRALNRRVELHPRLR